jgi:hypothetical protein
MVQRRYRRRAFHRVRQPDIKRNLRRFSRRSDEQQQRDRAQDAEVRCLHVKGSAAQDFIHWQEAHGAERREHQQHAQDKRGVTDAVDDERLLTRVPGGFFVEVESDQQVTAQPHAFPADEQQQVVAAQHQDQHEEHEQIEIGKEAVVAALMRHVAGSVNVNQRADAGDDHHHHGT